MTTYDAPAVSLGVATATGAGAAYKLSKIASKHTVQVIMGGAVVATAVTVDLEGSIDGTNFYQLARHIFTAGEITAEAAMFSVVDFPVAWVRLNLITLTGGTTPNTTTLYVDEGSR